MITFFVICVGAQNLKVPRNMQAAHGFPAKRDDVIDMMRDSTIVSELTSAHIDTSNFKKLVAGNPRWSCSQETGSTARGESVLLRWILLSVALAYLWMLAAPLGAGEIVTLLVLRDRDPLVKSGLIFIPVFLSLALRTSFYFFRVTCSPLTIKQSKFLSVFWCRSIPRRLSAPYFRVCRAIGKNPGVKTCYASARADHALCDMPIGTRFPGEVTLLPRCLRAPWRGHGGAAGSFTRRSAAACVIPARAIMR